MRIVLTMLVVVMATLIPVIVSARGHLISEISALISRDSDDPWLINQFVCPPILCGTGLSSAIQGDPGSVPQASSAAFPFFEGDIVLDGKLKAQLDKVKAKVKAKFKDLKSKVKGKFDSLRRRLGRRSRRSIVKPASRHWKYGIIPYEIDQNLSDETQEAIHRAHRHIEDQTCLRFKHKEDTDPDYISYINQPGCWSYIGRTGGQQVISLGRGCEKMGTAVHETCHALGFWHEQSRLDRDKYVKILKKNVSPSGREQFDRRSTGESYSKGFVYDYNSIMHYGEKYFTSNGKPTIEIKGIGKKLGMKIGQRKILSELDVAQLNDIYYCNSKDQDKRVCSKGWEAYDGSCYKFAADDKQQYSGSRDACASLGAQLVKITNSNKDRFLKRVLQERHADLPTWRTAGRKIGDQFKWEDPSGKKRHRNMKYKVWSPRHPAKYTTLVLDVATSKNDTRVWKGTWAGTPSKPNQFSYPYICEKKDYRCEKDWINWADKCYSFNKDREQFDRAHRKCVSMSGHLVHINNKHEDRFIKDHLIKENLAIERWRTGGTKRGNKFHWYDKRNNYKTMVYRNWSKNHPGRYSSLVLSKYSGTPARYVWKGVNPGDSSKPKELKYSFICEKPAKLNCFKSSTKDGRDFREPLSYTEQGISCQKWTSQYPQRHDYMSGNVKRDHREGLGDHNYCRNPGGKRARPWCYVPLKTATWQYCDVSICK